MIYIVGHQQVENLNRLHKDYTYLNTTELFKTNPDDIILQSHRFLNEWIAQYYIVNYTDLKDDIYGFCHYRRVIDYQEVQKDLIIYGNKVQIFQNSLYFMPKPVYLTLKCDHIEDYQLVYTYVVREFGSKKMYNWFLEYMNTLPVEIRNKWNEKTRFVDVEKPGRIEAINYCPLKTAPSREIFVMNKQNLINMTNFLSGYVKLIFNKLEINNLDKINEIFYNTYKYGLIDKSLIDDNYSWIYNKHAEHRLIAYTLELLIGLYIHVNCESIRNKNIWDNNFINGITYFMD